MAPQKAGTLEDHLFLAQTRERIVLEAPDGERTQNDWPPCFRERRFKPRPIHTTYAGGTL